MLQRVNLHSDAKVVQVVANWSYSTLLTEQGTIYTVPKPDLVVASALDAEPTPTDIVTAGLDASDFGLSDDKIVQIAGLDKYTIALTRFGRVLKVGSEAFTGSPMDHVAELVHFSSQQDEVNDRSRIMKRFITGSFNNFAVYTKEQVMLGNIDATRDTEPNRIPELDNQDICKVTFGE